MAGETTLYSTGLNKQVRFAAETVWGTPASTSAASARLLRRVQSDISLRKATYRSNEIQPDRQIHDFRHGVRSIQGTLRTELSPLTQSLLFAQLLAGTFAATPTTASMAIDALAAVVNTSPGTFQRQTGNFVTDGFKVGDIVNFAGFTGGAAGNNARNYRITSIFQTTSAFDTIGVGPTPSTNFPSVGNEVVAPAAHGTTGATVTMSMVGKKLITPTAGNANDQSFTFEHWFQDIGQDEIFSGCRASRTQVRLPPTGLATADFDIEGKDVLLNAGAGGMGFPYFTAPTGITTSTILASVNGILRVGGVDYAIVTGLDFQYNPNYTRETVVGSNVTPYLFPGIHDCTGTFTAIFLDEVLEQHFVNEDEISLQVYMTTNNSINPDFVSFYFPRIKLGSGMKDDKPGAIVQTFSFQALNNVSGGSTTTGDQTTLAIQDSLAA